MTTNRPEIRMVLTSALVALLLAGCGTPDQTTSPSPTPVQSSQTPTPTPSPTPTLSAGEQAAVDAAQAALALYDQLAADPTADIEELTTVARDSAYLTWARRLSDYRVQGLIKTGTTVRQLIGTAPGTDARQWIVTLCIDSSEVDVVDASGNSVVDKTAPARTTGIYTVTQDPTQFDWFVTEYEVSGTC